MTTEMSWNMAGTSYRIGIVGASSLAGKELADVLGESVLAASTFVLLDGEELAGSLTSAGEEAAVIQRLDADSFAGMDIAFFSSTPEITKSLWQAARKAGAGIVDLTNALGEEADVFVRSPWVEEVLTEKASAPDLATAALIAAHPAAVMLALVAACLKAVDGKSMAATIMEPASDHGRSTMDELQQQTVKLLSFQPLPTEQYDAQVAFNLLPRLGDAAKISIEATQRRIVQHYHSLGKETLPSLAVQLVQAPVFHGYTASVLIDLNQPHTLEQVQAALSDVHIDLVSDDSAPPSNLAAAGQETILLQVASADETGTRFWVWMAADNLKLHALNAVACALELTKLRPAGKVQ